MAKEVFETEQAQAHYEQCVRYLRMVFPESHYRISKIYFRMAENMMRERGNEQTLKRAQAFLAKNLDLLKDILEVDDEEELENSSSLYIALHFQFKGKLMARLLDPDATLRAYQKSEQIYLRANNGRYSCLMQSFFQFVVDDLQEVGLAEEAQRYNKLYKQTLKENYSKDSIFYVAYTVDIVAQQMQEKPMKAFT